MRTLIVASALVLATTAIAKVPQENQFGHIEGIITCDKREQVKDIINANHAVGYQAGIEVATHYYNQMNELNEPVCGVITAPVMFKEVSVPHEGFAISDDITITVYIVEGELPNGYSVHMFIPDIDSVHKKSIDV